MKTLLRLLVLLILCVLALSACGAQPTAAPTAAPTVEPPTAAPTTAPTAESQPTAAPSPTLAPINLAGPPMEVGSKYRYVDGSVLVAVPGGEFTMGYNAADNPEHKVTLSDFWIYSTKVTNQQYQLCVGSGQCPAPDAANAPDYSNPAFANFPVTGVVYDSAVAYCTFVHGRLPTEAEWEKTARGPEANLFPWGNKGTDCSLLNFNFCVGKKTTAVNAYPDGVSYYSALDMSGNAREWVADWYSPTYYSEGQNSDPLGPVTGQKRSVRGSSYQDSADPSLSAHRFSLLPNVSLPDLGFRCVIEDPTYFAPACQSLAYVGTGPTGEGSDCTPAVQCNTVGISQSPNCSGSPSYQAYTIVTFSLTDTPPTSWSYDVPGCSSPVSGDPNKFLCTAPGSYTASAQGSCVDTVSCAPSCPAHYNKVGDSCVWDGSGTGGTACIPGMTYDPLTQCCSATPGAAVNFDLCPAGYYQLGGSCVLNPKKTAANVLQSVDFISCAPRAREGCSEPQPGYCSQLDGIWDPNQCCCTYYSSGTCMKP